MENSGQGLHQLPEVHPLVRGEVEQNFAAVKGALRAHKLHIQTMLLDFLHTHIVGPLLPRPVLGHDLQILLGSPAEDLTQRGDNLIAPDKVVGTGAGAELRPPGGIHNDRVTGDKLHAVRVKIVNLLPRAELNVHDLQGFGQFLFVFFHEKAPL